MTLGQRGQALQVVKLDPVVLRLAVAFDVYPVDLIAHVICKQASL
jgi:hypothetical protein